MVTKHLHTGSLAAILATLSPGDKIDMLAENTQIVAVTPLALLPDAIVYVGH